MDRSASSVVRLVNPIVGFGMRANRTPTMHVYRDVKTAIEHHTTSEEASKIRFFDATGRPLDVQLSGAKFTGLVGSRSHPNPKKLDTWVNEVIDHAQIRVRAGEVPPGLDVDFLSQLEDMSLAKRLDAIASAMEDGHANMKAGGASKNLRGWWHNIIAH